MIILVNGSFGVGKTTVARILVKRIPGSILFNPEIIGFVFQRLPKFISFRGRGTDDYQDILLWRRLAALIPFVIHKIGGRTIIIPMAFSNLAYLDQIRSDLSRKEIKVHHFCLTAPLDVIHERLWKRGLAPSSAEGLWVYRRAAECCDVHARPEFSVHVNTVERLPVSIAEEILRQIWAAPGRSC
jgi:hypothetical protein